MITPYPYQTEVVRQITRLDGKALVAMPMGTGKSVIALMYIQENPTFRPIIVVCPASLKWQWEREAAHHIGMRAEVLEGMKPKKGGMRIKSPMFIINYDILGKWVETLKSLNPQLIVLDESQYIANRRAQRSKATMELCRGIPHVIALSGTPLVNRPVELWSTLNVLRPWQFPSFYPFAFKFCAAKKTQWGWDFGGASNMNELHKTLTGKGGVMIRRRKEEVLKDLPAKQRIIIPLSINDRSEYDLILKDFAQWLRGNKGGVAYKSMKAQALVKLNVMKHTAARLKLPLVLEWLENFLYETNEKVIVFCVHRDVITELKSHYKNSVVVDGSVIGKKRQLAIDKFLNTKTRILFGNIKAAGVGWSAKGCSTVAFAEIGWNPGSLTQAEDRCHGLRRGVEGQHTQIYYFVAKDTVEEKLLELVQRKQQVFSNVMDGVKSVEDFNVFDKLLEELTKTSN